jgi:surface protein
MYRKGLSSRANKISSMIASTDNSGPGSTGQDSVPTAGTHGIRKNVFRRMPALIPKKSQSRFSSMVIHTRPFPFFTRLELINAIDEYFFTNINGAWRKFGDIASWDVSRIEDMSHLFANAAAGGNDTIANLTENKLAGISNWNVSSVTTMTAMFKGSKFNGDLSKWNVSKVTDFSSMFALSLIANDTMLKWDVRSGTDFSSMFSSASNFTTNLSYWNVKSEATLTDMFLVISGGISGSVKPAATPVFNFFNKITFLTGDEAITHERTQQFVDPGATTVTGEIPVVQSSNLNIDADGAYTITYSATNPRGSSGTIDRIVTVVDTVSPVITLNGLNPMTLEIGQTYTEESGISSEGGLVTASGTVNTALLGINTITYTTTDAADNVGTTTRTVEVVDTTPPAITSGTTGIDLVDATEAGQTVYTITTSYAVGTTIFTIGGTDASLLSVDSSTGVVKLTAAPSYTGQSSYSFTVTARDDGGNITAPTTVTFSITQAV